MTIQFTAQQQQEFDQAGSGSPLRWIDPRTNRAYRIIPESEYDFLQQLAEDVHLQNALHTMARANAGQRLKEESE